MRYFLNKPTTGKLEKKYILDVIKSNWLSSNGKHTIEFGVVYIRRVRASGVCEAGASPLNEK